MAAFFMSYMGKWVRRSNVMSGADWMVTRFGDGPDGRSVRISYTIMAVVMLTRFIGYAFQGIGKFQTGKKVSGTFFVSSSERLHDSAHDI